MENELPSPPNKVEEVVVEELAAIPPVGPSAAELDLEKKMAASEARRVNDEAAATAAAQIEKEKAAALQIEKEKAAALQIEKEKAAAAQIEKERAAALQIEKEKAAASAAAAQELIASKAAAKIEMEKEMERERLAAERAQALKVQAQQVEAVRIEALRVETQRKDELARQERERLAKKEELDLDAEMDAELQMIDAADAHEEEEDLDALLAEDELVDRKGGGGETSGRKDDEVSLEDAGDEEDW